MLRIFRNFLRIIRIRLNRIKRRYAGGQFPNWEEVLKRSQLAGSLRRSFAITIRWYLSFCRRSQAGVNVQSARDFIEWAQKQKAPEEWKLESWKQAIRWFFRTSKGMQCEPGNDPKENLRAAMIPREAKGRGEKGSSR